MNYLITRFFSFYYQWFCSTASESGLNRLPLTVMLFIEARFYYFSIGSNPQMLSILNG